MTEICREPLETPATWRGRGFLDVRGLPVGLHAGTEYEDFEEPAEAIARAH